MYLKTFGIFLLGGFILYFVYFFLVYYIMGFFLDEEDNQKRVKYSQGVTMILVFISVIFLSVLYNS